MGCKKSLGNKINKNQQNHRGQRVCAATQTKYHNKNVFNPFFGLKDRISVLGPNYLKLDLRNLFDHSAVLKGLTKRQRVTKIYMYIRRTPKRAYLVTSAGSSWLVSDSDTRSIELSANPVPSPAACKYSTVPRAELWSSLVRRLCLATASMWGERSTPVMRRAKGKVCASFRVDSPVEQPISRMSFGSGPFRIGFQVYARACVFACVFACVCAFACVFACQMQSFRALSQYSSGCFDPKESRYRGRQQPHFQLFGFFIAALQPVRDQNGKSAQLKHHNRPPVIADPTMYTQRPLCPCPHPPPLQGRQHNHNYM